jgi:predicted Zn-dependent protease
MLKFLDKVDQLAGLLAHLIVHVDQRQTTSAITNAYGLSKLISIANATASSEEISEVVSGLEVLSYSEDFEEIADALSVDYLQNTKYACNSTSLFFSKLQQGLPTISTFWDTHKNPADRITRINDKATLSGCSTNLWHDNGDNGEFAAMITTLP